MRQENIELPEDVDSYLNHKLKEKEAEADLFTFMSRKIEGKNRLETSTDSYDQDAEGFEPDWFIPEGPISDRYKFLNEYKGRRPKGVHVDSTSYSMARLEFNHERDNERYIATTRPYLIKQFQSKRWDHDDFSKAMIDKHGVNIVKFLKKFYEELYINTLQVEVPASEESEARKALNPKGEEKGRKGAEESSIPPKAVKTPKKSSAKGTTPPKAVKGKSKTPKGGPITPFMRRVGLLLLFLRNTRALRL